MVFVGVGDDDTVDFIFDRMQIAEIGDQNIDTVHRFIGKAHSHVDDDGAVFGLQYCHIAADLSQAA